MSRTSTTKRVEEADLFVDKLLKPTFRATELIKPPMTLVEEESEEQSKALRAEKRRTIREAFRKKKMGTSFIYTPKHRLQKNNDLNDNIETMKINNDPLVEDSQSKPMVISINEQKKIKIKTISQLVETDTTNYKKILEQKRQRESKALGGVRVSPPQNRISHITAASKTFTILEKP